MIMDQHLDLLSSVAIAIHFANNGYDINIHYVINRLLANKHSNHHKHVR